MIWFGDASFNDRKQHQGMRRFHQIRGMQQDINRDLGFAKMDWNGARNGFIWDMVDASMKGICWAIPDVT